MHFQTRRLIVEELSTWWTKRSLRGRVKLPFEEQMSRLVREMNERSFSNRRHVLSICFLWQLKFQCHLSKEDWPIWMTPCETLRADVLVVPFLVENNKLEFNHQVDISITKGAKPRIRLEMRIRVPARYVWFTRYLVLVVASVSFPSLCMSREAEGRSTKGLLHRTIVVFFQ